MRALITTLTALMLFAVMSVAAGDYRYGFDAIVKGTFDE